MLKKYNINQVFPITDLSNIKYWKTNLDLIQGDYIVCKVYGDATRFMVDCPSAKDIELGDWDNLIITKLIYSEFPGNNGIERIKSYIERLK